MRSSIVNKLLTSNHYILDKSGYPVCRYFKEQSTQPNMTEPFLTLKAGTSKDIFVNPQNAWKAYDRLDSYIRAETKDQTSIYVFDHHNLAYYCWHEALVLGDIESGATLVHIDAHTDDLCPSYWPAPSSLAEIAEYAKDLGIIDFILPALAEGLANEFWHVNHLPENPTIRTMIGKRWEREFGPSLEARLLATSDSVRDDYAIFNRPKVVKTVMTQFSSLEEILRNSSSKRKLIIDIDLDSFIRLYYPIGTTFAENDFTDLAVFVAMLAQSAGTITIATSPYFADQIAAIIAARRIIRECET